MIKSLEKDDSLYLHGRNIQYIAVEMYKVSNELSPPLITDISKRKNSHPYNLRYNSRFSRPLVKTLFHWTESMSYLAPEIWDIFTATYKELPCLENFKNCIENWKPENFARYTLVELVF